MGRVYFDSGHVEEITYFEKINKNLVRFTTRTGIYCFLHPKFYKERCTTDNATRWGGMKMEVEYIEIPGIVRIEIQD